MKSYYLAEQELEYRRWTKEIPFIKFDADWEVKVIPPFAGAVVRFFVRKGAKEVSVYLDCYDNLGYMDKKPHWEIYPDKDDENSRFYMNETEELLSAIREALS
jgi:hypothetical protein